MTPTIEPQTVPLTLTPEGVLMVTGTRVPLDTIVYSYREGYSVEQIVDNYSTVSEAAAYAVLAYYLNHRSEVDAYLVRREAERAELRREIEQRFPPDGIKERLLARLRSRVNGQ